jgi:hypothetical protein
MQSIADFLTVKLNTSYHHGSVEYWCVDVASFERMHIVVDYLAVYTLLTSKRNDFMAFKRAFDLILAGKHLTPEGKLQIRQLKNGMNKKRTVFDWSHLN